MSAIPLSAKLCHKCGENYVGRLCPKCTPKAAHRRLNPVKEIQSPAAVIKTVSKGLEWGGENKPVAKRTMSAPALNKTEQRWQAAHPSHHPFPVKLRWGKCMVYSPDFLFKNIAEQWAKPILIEVKGGWIESRDICRFKGCAAEWGWLFEFRMMQWKDREWTRIY